MADRGAAGQAFDSAAIVAEAIADEAHVTLGSEGTALAVEGDDAAGFLPAMLQGVEAKGG
jgi:N-acetylglucosamine-6-phosphate deacetylase